MATGVELATAWVRIVPTVEGIQGAIASELDPVEDAAEKTGRAAGEKMSTGMKAAISLASAFIVREIVGVAKEAIESLARIERINAQTAAAIEATGGTAGVTATHVEALAGSLENLTATEAESIQEGANLLLTFKNIQNQAGEGNDIFDQSVVALTDMARAMGQEPAAAAIQLGKALNDPIAGIAALSRVGIQFTDEQKDLITSLVESGQTMEAQKIILAELNSQFGGSGEAYAATYAGQVDLLNHSIGTASETMLSAFMPALSAVTTAATGFFNFLAEHPDVLTALAIAIGVVTVAIVGANVAMWAMAANPIVLAITAIVVAVGLLIAAIVLLVMNWDEVVAWVSDVWSGFVGWLSDSLAGLGEWWSETWAGMVGFFQSALDWIVDAFLNWTLVGQLIQAISFLASNWDAIWGRIGQVFEDVWNGIGNFFRGVANWILNGIESFINGAVDLLNGILAPINAVSGAIADVTGIGIRVPLLPHVNIPGLWEGGQVLASGSVLVGERGPEILNLPRGASVEPLDDARSEGVDPGPIDLTRATIDALAAAVLTRARRDERMEVA